jgi:predicted transposase/invertase (TIGR01784 family)
MAVPFALNRLNDYLFKRIFGVPENKDILLDFLNSIILTDVNGPLTDLSLDDREIDPEFLGDKAARLDILATTTSGTRINIEVQLVNIGGPEKRTLFYWARLYGGQMVAGDLYPTLLPVITVNVVNFEFLPHPDRFHQTFLLQEMEEQTPLTRDCEIHFLEVPKFRRQRRAPKTKLDDWLTYLSNVQGKALERITMRQPAIKRAQTIEEIFLQDARERRMYEQREKGLRDMATLQATLMEKAVAEAMENARKIVAAEVREQVAAQVREEVAAEVREEVAAEVREEVAAEVREQVAVQVREKVTAQVREEVGAERRALARRLLDKGLSRGEVQELTGLPMDEIAGLTDPRVSEEPAPYRAPPPAARPTRKRRG